MAVADAYATVPEYRLVAGNTDRGVEDGIRRDLLAVSRMLDLRLRRHFNREAAATEHQRLAASAQSAAHRLRNKAKTLRRERRREAKANG